MIYEINLALKYLRAGRKSLARWTAIAAIIGITAGVAGLIAAESLTRGFRSEMQDKILANTAHIIVYKTDGGEIENFEEVKKQTVNSQNVREVLPTSYESALLVSPSATNYAVLRIKENLEPKTEDKIKIAIGAELADKSNLKQGDETEIIIPTSQSEFAPKTAKVFVGEIFRTGIFEYDSTWIYIAPKDFAEILQRPDFAPKVLSIFVKDIYAADKTAEDLRSQISKDFRILDWQEANRPLFAALSLEKKVVFAVISLVIFIAALNITTTLALLVNERRADIAVLRTCGAKTKSLVLIFLFEGLLLGAVGLIAGIALGLTLCEIGNYFKIISLSAEIYSLNYIPLIPSFESILQIAAMVCLIVLIACFYPAWKAAKIKPLENLRNV